MNTDIALHQIIANSIWFVGFYDNYYYQHFEVVRTSHSRIENQKVSARSFLFLTMVFVYKMIIDNHTLLLRRAVRKLRSFATTKEWWYSQERTTISSRRDHREWWSCDAWMKWLVFHADRSLNTCSAHTQMCVFCFWININILRLRKTILTSRL